MDKLDVEFKGYHYELLGLTDDEETLKAKQKIPDEHDDNISQLYTSIKSHNFVLSY